MVVPVVPIGVMLGKADSAFKLVGGSSIVFNALRSRIFGKVLRTVEYPDGELHSIKMYRMSLYRLKNLIADTQPPPFPTAFLEAGDIKQVAVFTSPHFTEPVRNDADVSALPDNAWLFWSKNTLEESPIPTRGVKLDGSHIRKEMSPISDLSTSDQMLQDEAIEAAKNIRKSQQYSRLQYDRIIDLAIDRDSGLLAIARNFGLQEDEFRIHSTRLLQRRDSKSILITEEREGRLVHVDAQWQGADGAEDGPRGNREPQVELTSRE